MVQVVCQENAIIEGKNYFIIEMGNSCNSKKKILDDLLQQRLGLKEVHHVADSDVILVLCTISSRTGTDIDAALKELNSFSASKPAIFIVLHHTFDPEKIIPDSSRYVTRENTLTVDCLVNEDSGLLKCNRNEEALTKIVHLFKPQNLTSYYISSKDRENQNLSRDQSAENDRLITDGDSMQRCLCCARYSRWLIALVVLVILIMVVVLIVYLLGKN